MTPAGHFVVVHEWLDGWAVLRSLLSAPEEVVMQVRRRGELACSVTVDFGGPDSPYVHPPSMSSPDAGAGLQRFAMFAAVSLPACELRDRLLMIRASLPKTKRADPDLGLCDAASDTSLLLGEVPGFWKVGESFEDWLPHATRALL